MGDPAVLADLDRPLKQVVQSLTEIEGDKGREGGERDTQRDRQTER